jgi:hypothetical protein
MSDLVIFFQVKKLTHYLGRLYIVRSTALVAFRGQTVDSADTHNGLVNDVCLE